MRMTVLLALAAISLTVSVAAFAASPATSWTAKDMKTAIRGLGYPKPHPVKLTCKGLGTADTSGRFMSFRCTATYRHHIRRRFVIAGRGEGGWLCSGKTLATCKLLRHGFATPATVASDGGPSGQAELAAKGYVQNRYGIPQPFVCGALTQTATQTWQKCYQVTDTSRAMVTVTLKTVRGGYLETASASPTT